MTIHRKENRYASEQIQVHTLPPVTQTEETDLIVDEIGTSGTENMALVYSSIGELLISTYIQKSISLNIHNFRSKKYTEYINIIMLAALNVHNGHHQRHTGH